MEDKRLAPEVQEISNPSYAIHDVKSAIPAFIGYTQKNDDLGGIPEHIASLRDFEESFGGACSPVFKAINIKTDGNGAFIEVDSVQFEKRFFLYEAISLYFANGGEECYVVSLGTCKEYTAMNYDKEAFLAAIEALESVEDVTLLVMPETILLGESCYEVQEAALAHCAKKRNRVAILDLVEMTRKSDSEDAGMGNVLLNWRPVQNQDAWKESFQEFRDKVGILNLNYGAAYTPYLVADLHQAIEYNDIREYISLVSPKREAEVPFDPDPSTEASICSAVRTALAVLPPSAAVAGIYAATDRNRSVWKAPANVSLEAVSGLTQNVSAQMQEVLNMGAVAGKPINGIRSFPGKGYLVWGARTLDGNSPDWRYINVRRFVGMVEESIRRTTASVVFESNDAKLWGKVKAMIDNYLLQKWKDGAIMGASPYEAWFVNVGLGSTMTEQDILEERLIVDIGMAVVRPAEFIPLHLRYKVRTTLLPE